MRERTWSMNFVRWNWVFCHLDKEISVHEIRKKKGDYRIFVRL